MFFLYAFKFKSGFCKAPLPSVNHRKHAAHFLLDGRQIENTCVRVCVFLSNLFIMRGDKPSDRLADGLRVELLFLFRFPITSYNIFHFLPLSPSTLAHTAFIHPHTHTLNYFLSSACCASLSLTLYVRSISVPSLPAGSQWQR